MTHSKTIISNNSNLSTLFSLALVLVFLLQWVWPMPGTIALRNGLLGLLLILCVGSAIFAKSSSLDLSLKPLRWPILIFAVLTLWIFLIGVLGADEPDLSRKEFVSQWLLPIGCALIAWLLVRWATVCDRQQALIKTVFYAFFSAIVIQTVMGLWFWWEVGAVPFRNASFLYIPRLIQNQLDNISYASVFDTQYVEKFSFFNNLFVALLLAELVGRVLLRKRWLQVPNFILLGGLFMAMLCSYWIRARNGSIELVLQFIICGATMVFTYKGRYSFKRKLIFIIPVLTLILILGIVFVKSDSRWQVFRESAAVAIDGDVQQAWLYRKNYPVLKNGEVVDLSAYERVSWIKEGVKLVQQYPFGTGFNRNAFFDTVDREYGLNGLVRGGHSHSGLIDFVVANGIPGVLMWLFFLISCAYIGWRMVRSGEIAQGLAVMCLALGAINRGAIDSNIRDHVLQQFLFLLTIYMTLNCAATSRVTHGK